ncbi:MAG: hypothetical protein DCF16_13120 [Alphaproteobacteria bacterium]|nr:MAG: hypothetical protein DCF16_13120 [Alphaproteobacteria bacterium]
MGSSSRSASSAAADNDAGHDAATAGHDTNHAAAGARGWVAERSALRAAVALSAARHGCGTIARRRGLRVILGSGANWLAHRARGRARYRTRSHAPRYSRLAERHSGIDLINNPERSGDGDGVDADAQDAGDRCGVQTEDSYHGTHVAGTIGAASTNDRVGVAGGAWDVTVIPVRVLGRCGGELADIVSGIRWAAGIAPAVNAAGQQIVNRTQADIINMSLSIQAPCPASLQSAIDAAVARNVVVVVAAGNKANQASLYAPANCNNVLVVGASDARGGLSFYSNFGPQIDLLAPGGDVFADSDNDGRPDGVLSTRATTAGCYDPANSTSTERCYYSFLQGTSMATPHVSAALALLASQSGLRGRQLEDALMTRAIAPHGAEYGQIECARSRYATPITAGSPTCARPSGRGMLDLSRALGG